MKLLIGGLIILFVLLQARLWFGDGGFHEVSRAKKEVTRLNGDLASQRDVNLTLRAEVTDLGNGLGEIEERARSELGMIGNDETFYQFVGKENGVVSDDRLAQGKPATVELIAVPSGPNDDSNDSVDAELAKEPVSR